MLGGKSEVRPSRSVHLCCVKQVHSVLISYGHQILRHLGSHKKWDRERETMDKFQLPRGRSWRALCWEGNTVVIISNIHHATIVSRYRACGILKHVYNWKHWDLFSTKAIWANVVGNRLLMQTERDSRDLTSSEICDPNVTQVPEQRGETETFVLFERLKQRGIFSCLCTNSPNPRQETRRPDFPRFLWEKKERKKKEKKKIRNKQWGKTSVWSVGTWDTFEHSITGEIPSYSPLMCVSDKQRAE